ncbi:NAD-dependent epimerase/dehydratase family protein [Chitinophaga solisilvae]|uniref:NAD-dependent epimerase/dehydratase family protein n=1 Tax=Chitinophaga solisilvae TaxID=1233460 RepID=UPI00136FDE90|nr:NAD(P)-dependent oxidoreductase [Chitinophaga solisilvae]
MKTEVTNILLTGATGILGSEVMYQLLAAYASGELSGKLVLLIRSIPEKTAEERLLHMLEYPERPQYIHLYSTAQLMEHILLIDAVYYQLTPADTAAIAAQGPLYLIHSAASTNMGYTAEALREIYQLNYLGTLYLLKTLTPYLRKFTFISTIYSKDILKGAITDEYINLHEDGLPADWNMVMPQSPYILYKIIIEREIVTWCVQHQLEWQILRPGLIGGRLTDAPLYHAVKYNVFYQVGIVFTNWKARNSHLQFPAPRIAGKATTQMDIVPVDYVAQAICRAFRHPDIRQLNIILSKPISLREIADEVFRHLEATYEFTDRFPDNQTPQESYYYQKCGEVYTRYLLMPPHQFNTSRLRALMHDIPEPDITAVFQQLYSYAYQLRFSTGWENYRSQKKVKVASGLKC